MTHSPQRRIFIVDGQEYVHRDYRKYQLRLLGRALRRGAI